MMSRDVEQFFTFFKEQGTIQRIILHRIVLENAGKLLSLKTKRIDLTKSADATEPVGEVVEVANVDGRETSNW